MLVSAPSAPPGRKTVHFSLRRWSLGKEYEASLRYKMSRALERMAIFVSVFSLCIFGCILCFQGRYTTYVDTWRSRGWTGFPICLLIVAISWPLADLIFLPSHIRAQGGARCGGSRIPWNGEADTKKKVREGDETSVPGIFIPLIFFFLPAIDETPLSLFLQCHDSPFRGLTIL